MFIRNDNSSLAFRRYLSSLNGSFFSSLQTSTPRSLVICFDSAKTLNSEWTFEISSMNGFDFFCFSVQKQKQCQWVSGGRNQLRGSQNNLTPSTVLLQPKDHINLFDRWLWPLIEKKRVCFNQSTIEWFVPWSHLQPPLTAVVVLDIFSWKINWVINFPPIDDFFVVSPMGKCINSMISFRKSPLILSPSINLI